MKKFLLKIKEFLVPISYTKWRWRWVFISEIYDAFQSVFTVQVWVYIISAIEKKNIDNIKFWWIVLIITYLLSYVFWWIREMCRETTNWNMNLWLRRKFFDQYIHLDNTEVEKIWTWKMQSIIFDWIWNRSNLLSETFVFIIVEVWAIIYAFILISTKSPNRKYFLWFLILFIISSTLIWIGLWILQNTRKQSKEIWLDLVRRDIKVLMSKFEILQNNKLSLEMDKQETLLNKQIKIRQKWNTKKLFRQTWASVILDWIKIWIYMSVWVGIILWNYNFAYMMLLLQLLNIISHYIWNIRNYLKNWYKSMVHVEKLQETFESIPLMKNNKNAKDFIYKKGNIILQKIYFSYDKNHVLQNFNLNIQGWTKTAFVWESWWWKTTLIKLLAWYISPDKWEVIIDWQKLSQIKLTDYYKHIGCLLYTSDAADE